MKKYIINLFIYFVTVTFLGDLLYFYFADSGIERGTLSIIINLSLYAIILLSCIICLKDDIVHDFSGYKKIETKYAYLFVGYGMILAGNYLCTILFTLLGITDPTSANQGGIEELVKGGYYLIFIPTILIAPFVEELVFRKTLFEILKKLKINKYVILAVSSIIFGMIHIIFNLDNGWLELLLGLPYVTTGLALGYVYIQNNENIFVPISVHFLNNLIATIVVLTIK